MPSTKTLAVFDAIAGRSPATNYAQLDLRNHTIVLDFDDTVVESVSFAGLLPIGYAQNDLQIVVGWSAASAVSGNVVWQAEFERQAVGNAVHGTHDLDIDNFGPAATTTATAATNSGELVRTIISLSADAANNPVPGESFRLKISRLATSGTDTMAGDAELVIIELREV